MSQHRGLRRSSHLFRSFLVEQTDPDRFYGDLAADSVATLADHVALNRQLVLDVGAGPRQFAEAFRARGARYVAVDHDPTVASVADGGVTGSALALPVADAAADFADVYPGGVRPMPFKRFLMKYQKPGSNSARACLSVSAT